MALAAGFTDSNFALSFWTALTFLILIFVLGKFAWASDPRDAGDAGEDHRRRHRVGEGERLAAEAASGGDEGRAGQGPGRVGGDDPAQPAGSAAAKNELMAQAKKESDELLQAARKSINEEKRQALAELRSQTVDLAIEAASRLVQMNMDEKKQKQLVEEYLSQLAEGSAGEH